MANYSNCSSLSVFKSFTPQSVDCKRTFSDFRNQHGIQNKTVTPIKSQKWVERTMEAYECHTYVGSLFVPNESLRGKRLALSSLLVVGNDSQWDQGQSQPLIEYAMTTSLNNNGSCFQLSTSINVGHWGLPEDSSVWFHKSQCHLGTSQKLVIFVFLEASYSRVCSLTTTLCALIHTLGFESNTFNSKNFRREGKLYYWSEELRVPKSHARQKL